MTDAIKPMRPSGFSKLYDLETYPVTVESGAHESPFPCPNGCGVSQDKRLVELKILQDDGPMISILQCANCRKRWLRVEYKVEPRQTYVCGHCGIRVLPPDQRKCTVCVEADHVEAQKAD